MPDFAYIVSAKDIEEGRLPGLEYLYCWLAEILFKGPEHVSLVVSGRVKEAFMKYYPVLRDKEGNLLLGEFYIYHDNLSVNYSDRGNLGVEVEEIECDKERLGWASREIDRCWLVIDPLYELVIVVVVSKTVEEIPPRPDMIATFLIRLSKQLVAPAAELGLPLVVYYYIPDRGFVRYSVGYKITEEKKERERERETEMEMETKKEGGFEVEEGVAAQAIRLQPTPSQEGGFDLNWEVVYSLASEKFGDRNVKIYREYKEGKYPGGYEEVKALLQRRDGGIGFKSKGDVSKLFGKIEGFINAVVGEAFEVWAQRRIGAEEGVQEVIPLGRAAPKGEADIVVLRKDGSVSIYSCKLRDTSPDSEAVSIEIRGAPELERAKELLLHGQTLHMGRKITVTATARVFVLFWNLGWGAGCIKEIVDPFNAPGHLLIKREECGPKL